MVTYSSYLPKTQNLPGSAGSIVMMNVLVTLFAGLAIFPAVFHSALNRMKGLHCCLPCCRLCLTGCRSARCFYQLSGGLFFAALTSAFSMVEIIVATVGKGDETKRKKLSWTSGLLIFLVGIPSCLSYGVLGDVHLFGKTFLILRISPSAMC